MKLNSVYIIQDKTLYGQGVADNFRAEARKLGMKILGYEGTQARANFSPLITPLKRAIPIWSTSAAFTIKAGCS